MAINWATTAHEIVAKYREWTGPAVIFRCQQRTVSSRQGVKETEEGGRERVWPRACLLTAASCVLHCRSGKKLEFADWMKTGLDPGTTLQDSKALTAADIVKMGMGALAPSAA